MAELFVQVTKSPTKGLLCWLGTTKFPLLETSEELSPHFWDSGILYTIKYNWEPTLKIFTSLDIETEKFK